VDSCSSDTDDSNDPTKPPPENYKLIDMLIFKEDNRAWQIYDVFINMLCAVSSYFYLFYASSRNAVSDEEFADLYYPIQFVFESFFFIYMVLKFFKEFKPVGYGRTDPSVREW
jgi:hypothetical protein